MHSKSRFGHFAKILAGAVIAVGLLACLPHQAPARQSSLPITVAVSDDLIEVDTGALQFGLSRGSNATIAYVERSGRRLVAGNEFPLLSATILESAEYDRLVDFVPNSVLLDAAYQVTELTYTTDADGFRAQIIGQLTFPGEDRIDFNLRLETSSGASHFSTELELNPVGPFHQRFIRDVRLHLPLSLEWRKRVAQGGDQGLEWDTRYYYEFTERLGRVLQDRNEWRYFAVEQASPEHFTIWRSESAGTAPLIHQHGAQAAGWTSVYDQHGGLLFGYRGLDRFAPKSLRVKAWGSGEAEVLLYPDSQPAFAPFEDSMATQVFGPTHRVDWIFFDGEHPEAWPDRQLAQLWNRETPLSGKRPERGFDDLLDADLELWDAAAADGDHRPIVSGGIPLARGEMLPDAQATVFSGNTGLPTQSRPLAYWPDGSVKWLHVLFPLTDAPGTRLPSDPRTEPFDISLRDGHRHSFALRHGEIPHSADRGGAVQIERDGDKVSLDNGQLRVELGLGDRWLRQVYLNGQPMLRETSERPIAFVDFVRVQGTYPVGTSHITGLPDPGPVHIDEITVEEDGPLRAVVLMKGTALSHEPTQIELRLKVYADRADIRLFHTAVFEVDDPRRAFLTQMGLRLPLRLDADQASVTAGGQSGPLVLQPGAAVSLRQFNPLHYRLIEQRSGVPQVAQDGRRSRGWLDVSDGKTGIQAVLRNMWQEHPKELTFRPETGDLEIYFWPAGSRAMDVRRYSDFPHLAQGETVGADNNWVLDHFYPEDHIFVGIARTHEAVLLFHDGTRPPALKDTLAADIQSPPLVYSGYDRYREKAVTLALPDYDRFPNVTRALDNLVDFWLFHQRFWNWSGMWDYGDIQHQFSRNGLGNTLAAEKLIEVLRTPAEDRVRQEFPSEYVQNDSKPQQDWLFDNGRWGWTNTEGLPGLFLQNEYLRTGRRDVFFAAEAMARHSRDVVTRHSGRHFGKGTRHGVQHWSDGNHELRQTVFSEYRLHYYLSGESRSRDVMTRLATDVYLNARGKRSADHSALVYGLFTLWEMTGSPEIGQALRDYIHAFIVPEGIDLDAEIELGPHGIRVHSIGGDKVNSTGMFGHNFGAMHGLLEYYRVTGDETLRDALLKMATAIGNPGRVGWTSKIIAFAAKYSTDPKPFLKALQDWIDNTGFLSMYLPVGSSPMHWTGETRFLRGSLPGSMVLVNNLPTLLESLDQEPKLTDRHRRDIARYADRSRTGENPLPYFPRLSWQHDYDHPEIVEHFGPWRPPESAAGAGSALRGPD